MRDESYGVRIRKSRRVRVTESIAVIGDRNSITVNAGQATQPVPGPRGGSPYRGLEAFQEEDSGYFFGRREATRDIADRLAERLVRPGFLLVSGASGARFSRSPASRAQSWS
jgi:hypothetical protein